MIRWLVSPELLSDEELVREHEATDGQDDRASGLLAEIQRRGLDV